LVGKLRVCTTSTDAVLVKVAINTEATNKAANAEPKAAARLWNRAVLYKR
jgi:hypothetical protein